MSDVWTFVMCLPIMAIGVTSAYALIRDKLTRSRLRKLHDARLRKAQFIRPGDAFVVNIWFQPAYKHDSMTEIFEDVGWYRHVVERDIHCEDDDLVFSSRQVKR